MKSNNLMSVWNNGLEPLNEIFREFDRSFGLSEWSPACEIEEEEGHYLVSLEVPGIPRDQIKLEVIDDRLIVSGERRQESRKNTEFTSYTERKFGKFQRAFMLPKGIDGEKVEANYQDGILRIYLPKAEALKPRQIKINQGAHLGFFEKLVSKDKAAS